MGLRDFIDSIREKGKKKKEMIQQMEQQMRAEEILQERKLSSNERELNRFLKEDREEDIKLQLHKMRKIRADDTNFGHNPLNAPNITNKVDFEILKQKNLFKGKSNMFSNQQSILKNNPNLLKNNMNLLRG